MTIVTVDLEEADYQEYYNGYANGTLWPLFHYRIDLTAYDRSFGEGYERVNRRFAETLAPLIEPDDLIWVHDYHLIPLGRELRRLGVTNPIGFFLHIPWPATQLLATLPRNRQLVEAMFSYDLVGFQTEDWLWAFESYVLGEAGGDLGARMAGSAPSARPCAPASSRSGWTSRISRPSAARPSPIRAYDRMAANSVFRSLIVGVDRLDYSKGLEERLLGFERFLADNPDMRRRGALSADRPHVPRARWWPTRTCASGSTPSAGRINGAYADMDLDADPLREPQLPARRAGGHLSRRQGRAGDAAARRHEPRGQGVCRRPGPRRSRRADPVPLRRRRAADARGADRQSLQPRGDVRGPQAGARP